MKIMGYTDELSVRPGQDIKVMVSTEEPFYDASLVRLRHGDADPTGPGYKEVSVDSAIAGRYPGRTQRIPYGSFVMIPRERNVPELDSFSVAVAVYPTTSEARSQGLVTNWLEPDGVGWGLVIRDDGVPALYVGDGQMRSCVAMDQPLSRFTWSFVVASFDRATSRVSLLTKVVKQPKSANFTSKLSQVAPGHLDLSVLLAAYWGRCADGGFEADGHFNGKLEAPWILARSTDVHEVLRMAESRSLADGSVGIGAAWDFSIGISSSIASDVSGNGHHGEVVNMPARAVTGWNWTGRVLDFRSAPEEYGAIYFHADDLEDALWESDFALGVPPDLESGVYAVRLAAEDEVDHVPFFVRRSPESPRRKISFLVPVFSYLAYANEHVPWEGPGAAEFLGARDVSQYIMPQDHAMVALRLLSLYDLHCDGSGCCYASRLRPLLSMRPLYRKKWINAPHQLSADLCILDWLEAKSFKYELVTDEDVHQHGYEAVAGCNVLITGSHPEYASERMLDAFDQYLEAGGDLMYLGGNGFYWVTAVHSEKQHVIEVRRGHAGTRTWESSAGEVHLSSTGEPGGLWRHRGRPPQKLVGVGFTAQGFDSARYYERSQLSRDPRVAFIFEGVDESEPIGMGGLVLGGAGGYEIDRADALLGTPEGALVLASARGFSDSYQAAIEDFLYSDSRQGGTVSPLVRADMTYWEPTDGRGRVFSVGSIAWTGSLSQNDYENAVSRVTENVLREFMKDR